jgi:hypothetical protein
MMNTLYSNGRRLEAAHYTEDLIGERHSHLCKWDRALQVHAFRKAQMLGIDANSHTWARKQRQKLSGLGRVGNRRASSALASSQRAHTVPCRSV